MVLEFSLETKILVRCAMDHLEVHSFSSPESVARSVRLLFLPLRRDLRHGQVRRAHALVHGVRLPPARPDSANVGGSGCSRSGYYEDPAAGCLNVYF